MARLSREERRDARQRRLKQSNTSRQGGAKIIPDCIDLSRLRGKIKMYEMKKRNNKIDILAFIVSNPDYQNIRDLKPYEIGPKIGIQPGFDDYKLQYAFHRALGAEKKDYLCMRHMFGLPCPACEELDPIWAKKKDERTKAELARADEIKHKWRVLYNIYDYYDPDAGIILWDYSYYLFEESLQDKIKGDEENGEDGFLDFIDLQNGKTITFDGKEGKFSTKDNVYYEADGIRFEDRDPYDDSIFDEVFPLDTLLVIPEYDEVARALLHMDAEPDSRPSSGSSEESGSPRGRGVRRQSSASNPEEPSRQTGGRGIGRKRQEEPPQEEVQDDIPPHVEGTCPEGLNFGTDVNTSDKCQKCSDQAYKACTEHFERLEKKRKEEEEAAKKQEETTSPDRSSMRRRRNV